MFNGVFQSSRVLITGFSGFKGSWLALWLSELGATVSGISSGRSERENLNLFGLRKRVRVYDCDLSNLKETKRIVNETKPQFVFHLAAQSLVAKAILNPVETVRNNIDATVNLLESMRLLNHPLVAIFASTDQVYENKPGYHVYRETDKLRGRGDIYSASKTCCEILIGSYYDSYFSKDDNVRIASVRTNNIIGGGDWQTTRLIPGCIMAWLKNEQVVLRQPKEVRPWQFVLEPLSGYLSVAQLLSENARYSGESFNFASSSKAVITVEELVDNLSKMFIANPGYKLAQHDASARATSLWVTLNTDKANNLLGWESVMEIKEVVSMIAEWYTTYCQAPEKVEQLTKTQLSRFVEMAKSKNLKWAA
jgi:CDP-glucose 4,6-dehydratase